MHIKFAVLKPPAVKLTARFRISNQPIAGLFICMICRVCNVYVFYSGIKLKSCIPSSKCTLTAARFSQGDCTLGTWTMDCTVETRFKRPRFKRRRDLGARKRWDKRTKYSTVFKRWLDISVAMWLDKRVG
jgi:hypothetical protein